MTVAIIGCGAIGRKRAAACKALGHEIVCCGDIVPTKAEELAREYGTADCARQTDRGALSINPRPDAYIIATPHAYLANCGRIAAERGAHVFLEKPGARRSDELIPVCVAAQKTGVVVHVGYSLRYHRAIKQAFAWLEARKIGDLMYCKGYYGHGGRLGYEQEWRMNRWLAGGGVGMDLMPHLIDLCMLFTACNFSVKAHSGHAQFWKSPVEDNLYLWLTAKHLHCELHASWTEWRNRFQFELIGMDGKITIDGIGGSYGVESASLYAMRPEMGAPDIVRHEYPGADESLLDEMRVFFADIQRPVRGAPSVACRGVIEAIAALEVIEQAGYCISAETTPMCG